MSERIETVPMSSVLLQDFSIPEGAATGKHTFFTIMRAWENRMNLIHTAVHFS